MYIMIDPGAVFKPEIHKIDKVKRYTHLFVKDI